MLVIKCIMGIESWLLVLVVGELLVILIRVVGSGESLSGVSLKENERRNIGVINIDKLFKKFYYKRKC